MFAAIVYFLGEKYVKTTKNVIKFMDFSFYFFPSSDMSLQAYFIFYFFLSDAPGIPLSTVEYNACALMVSIYIRFTVRISRDHCTEATFTVLQQPWYHFYKKYSGVSLNEFKDSNLEGLGLVSYYRDMQNLFPDTFPLGLLFIDADVGCDVIFS